MLQEPLDLGKQRQTVQRLIPFIESFVAKLYGEGIEFCEFVQTLTSSPASSRTSMSDMRSCDFGY